VTSQLSFFSDALKQNILQSTFQFSPSLQVNKPILVDIRRMHRVALPTEETTYVTDMHRAGVYTLQVSVILIIVIMFLYKTTRGHRSVWL
jgi:high-affinity K+ transport system ATPase subunit B